MARTEHATTHTAAPSHRWTLFVWIGAALLLLAPLVAMQLTTEVNWSVGDFTVLGLMLVAACGALELAVRATARPLHRLIIALGIGVVFVALWAELAVGIFH